MWQLVIKTRASQLGLEGKFDKLLKERPEIIFHTTHVEIRFKSGEETSFCYIKAEEILMINLTQGSSGESNRA